MSRARVVVVGAGPAGMMAAAQAARLGCAVLLVDEAPRPGGQIHRQPSPSLAGGAVSAAARPEAERKRRLFDRFARHAGSIDHRPGTSVTAVYGLDRILIADETSSQLIRADALVVATGLHERVGLLSTSDAADEEESVEVGGWTMHKKKKLKPREEELRYGEEKS
ncbi:FAD-dependent oxidoreductase, partial [Azospirillum argentinense]|uniref:FAD-dependent oxidoreductase n=1 Tax=Azospirillum argentinense TaxID=2970906 RepID=UPI00190E7AE1